MRIGATCDTVTYSMNYVAMMETGLITFLCSFWMYHLVGFSSLIALGLLICSSLLLAFMYLWPSGSSSLVSIVVPYWSTVIDRCTHQ